MEALGKVLLVDDDLTSNFISERVLRQSRLAARVSVAANGRQALDLVKRKRFNLILLDTLMPVMDGFEFLEALSSLQESTGVVPPAVVMLTSTIHELDTDRTARYAMVRGAIGKPLNTEHVSHLASLIAGAAYPEPKGKK